MKGESELWVISVVRLVDDKGKPKEMGGRKEGGKMAEEEEGNHEANGKADGLGEGKWGNGGRGRG